MIVARSGRPARFALAGGVLAVVSTWGWISLTDSDPPTATTATTTTNEADTTATTAPSTTSTTDAKAPASATSSSSTTSKPTVLSPDDFSASPKDYASNSGSLLTDIRVARQTGVDRIVFEFEGDAPETSVSYGPEPASGECVAPTDEASVFLNFMVRSSTKDYGASGIRTTYTGGNRVSDGTTAAVSSLVLTCDFEGQIFATVPLNREWPFALYTLANPGRVVVDIATSG